MTTEQKLLAQAKETFIKQRTQQEMIISEWAKKLATAKPEVLRGVSLPEPLTLESLIPELYADKPDEAIYKVQYDKAMELIGQVNKIADEYNEESIKCLSEYNQINSSMH